MMPMPDDDREAQEALVQAFNEAHAWQVRALTAEQDAEIWRERALTAEARSLKFARCLVFNLNDISAMVHPLLESANRAMTEEADLQNTLWRKA
jgi:hypothetical protein